MSIFDSMQAAMYGFIMTRGEVDNIVATLLKAFDKLELFLNKSKTEYFLDAETYSMVDLYGFPHTSRIFYLKDSALGDLYTKFEFEKKHPNLLKWFTKISALPELNDGKAIIPVSAFKIWLEELKTTEWGKKPPLRYPFKL